jgi:peroxiredoxin Q/BCP
MNDMQRALADLLLLLSCVSVIGCAHYPAIPAIGATAPEFTLSDQGGKSVSLKDYRGQWVILYFYPRDFSRFGTNGVRSFRRDQQKLADLHAVVLGLTEADQATHKAFAEQEHLSFPLLSDQGMRVAEQYGASHPTHIFYKYVIYSSFIIDPNGRIARVFYDFDPEDPSGQILSAVAALEHQ